MLKFKVKRKRQPARAQGRKRRLILKRLGRRAGGRFTTASVNRMIDEAHTRGYKAGYEEGRMKPEAPEGGKSPYDQGFDKGYDEGYGKGLYAGGDAIVDLTLPFDAILPEVSIVEIVEAGVEQLRSRQFLLQSTEQIAERIQGALDRREPFSLVRVGDGEVLTLAQELALPIDEVRSKGAFLGYAGVDVPDLAARDQLAASLRAATVVGIPKLRNFTYQPLAFKALQAHGIDYRQLSLTHSLVNYYLHQQGYLGGLLRGRRVLLAGNVMKPLAEVLTENGILVSAVVTPVNGVKDIPRVMEEIRGCSFDIALVSSGIAAVTIAERIASEMGLVALDFGHLADELGKRQEPFR
ncbi:GT-D fold domain-containing glycosyltransferase [Paenibacillus sp. S-38]|uniref:GT-D fold domain-containing protein n=1 Tax=Paenibacillus sp. S-38 TaxID=3416710 RepID=UPI003CEBCA46